MNADLFDSDQLGISCIDYRIHKGFRTKSEASSDYIERVNVTQGASDSPLPLWDPDLNHARADRRENAIHMIGIQTLG